VDFLRRHAASDRARAAGYLRGGSCGRRRGSYEASYRLWAWVPVLVASPLIALIGTLTGHRLRRWIQRGAAPTLGDLHLPTGIARPRAATGSGGKVRVPVATFVTDFGRPSAVDPSRPSTCTCASMAQASGWAAGAPGEGFPAVGFPGQPCRRVSGEKRRSARRGSVTRSGSDRGRGDRAPDGGIVGRRRPGGHLRRRRGHGPGTHHWSSAVGNEPAPPASVGQGRSDACSDGPTTCRG